MIIITSAAEMQSYARQARLRKESIGLVPTMGSLHAGHLSLIERARQSSDIVITSVFVNPTQFAPNEDFARYPRDVDRDAELCRSAGSTVLFVPHENDMYPEGFSTYITVDRLSSVMEGKFRPTHFRGVATIVAKLLLLTIPHQAVFGQKDAQQCAVVKKMVKDLGFDVEIIVAPIVREQDGLAMSSRNIYLSAQERLEAPVLSAALRHAEAIIGKGERDSGTITAELTRLIQTKPTAAIDYVELVDAESLTSIKRVEPGIPVLIALAVRFGTTRLIDNTIVTVH